MSEDACGIPVALHDQCLNCGCSTAFVGQGAAPLYWQLLCDGCGCERGYVSRELRDRLKRHVQKFGWPDGPIILRTGKVHKPAQLGVDAANATAPIKRKTAMKMQELFPSKYLRAADLGGTEPRIVTIDKVTHEDFKDDGATVRKTVVHFKRNGTATPPLVVNKTNWRMLVAITGADDDENWAGHRIELRSEKVNSPGGKIVDSIRVHEAPKAKKAKVAAEFNDEVGF